MRSHLFVCGISLLAFADSALAICPIVPPTYFVGPASDSNCNVTTIAAAVTAAGACPAVIEVSRQQQYKAIAVSIHNQSLTLAGTDVCGTISSSTTYTELVGDDVNSVLSIDGASFVTLKNLSLRGGRVAATSNGGGIDYFGTGSLSLDNVEVHNNFGGYGAGVSYYGSGSLNLRGVKIHDNSAANNGGGVKVEATPQAQIAATVIDDPVVVTEINSNIAGADGGGFYLAGNVHFSAVGDVYGGILVHTNQAGDEGGAMFLSSGALADIGLTGSAIYANKALDGGAFALATTNLGGPRLRLFGTVSGAQLTIASNIATGEGGALYLSSGSPAVHSTACVFDAAFSSNRAKVGGTVGYVDSNSHLAFNPESDAECPFNDVAVLGAQHCDSIAGCPSFSNNIASDGTNPTSAAVLLAAGSAVLTARRVKFEGNTDGPLLQSQSAAGASVSVHECLIDHNTGANYLFDNDGAAMALDGCTLTLNAVNQFPMINRSGTISLRRSIVQEFEPLYDTGVSSGISLQYAILNLPMLPTDSTVLYGDAGLVDAINGDFHLSGTSLSRDFAPAGDDSAAGDLERQPRKVDLSGVSNRFGPRDLGPYEYQIGNATDRIFLGNFD